MVSRADFVNSVRPGFVLSILGLLLASCGDPPPWQLVELSAGGEIVADQWFELESSVPLAAYDFNEINQVCVEPIRQISMTRSELGRIVFQGDPGESLEIEVQLVDRSGEALKIEDFAIQGRSYCAPLGTEEKPRAPFAAVRIKTSVALPFKSIEWQSIHKSL